MTVKIEELHQYKSVLRSEVEKFIKDNPKRADEVVEDLYSVFLDGVRFSQGKLVKEVAVDTSRWPKPERDF